MSGDEATRAAAQKGVASVASALGLNVPAAELEVIAEAVVSLVGVLGGAAQKRAKAAGEAAAARITTAEEAEKAERERT